MKKLLLCLFVMIGYQASMVASTCDGWQPVSVEKAAAFVENFYKSMSIDNGRWDDAVLERYLAPSVLQLLADSAANYDDVKYASWLLSGTDDSEMIKPSSENHAPIAMVDGRIAKQLDVYYWGDSWLNATQTLYFTVMSKGDRLYITRVDNMNGAAAADVWHQYELREEGREIDAAVASEEAALQEFEGNIGPFAITFFMNPASFDVGETIGNYYYNDRPNSVFSLVLVENEAVNASGSMHIVLKEYTANGNHTGTFDGQYETRGGGYEGTFTTSKGKKYHFELMEK